MADRWVCRSCWAANEDGWDKCFKCGVPRGTHADPLAAAASGADQQPPWWRRVPLQFAWIGVVAVVGVIGALNAASRDESGTIVGAGTLHIIDVRVGDCFDLNDGPDVEEVGEITAIPCGEPHTFEAFFATDLAAGPYPSRSALDAEIDRGCLPSFEAFVGRDYETSELYMTTFEPTPDGWEEGDRGLLCVVSTFNAETPLTGSVRDSAR